MKDQYREEKGIDVYSDVGSTNSDYTNEYVHWLEKKCNALQEENKIYRSQISELSVQRVLASNYIRENID